MGSSSSSPQDPTPADLAGSLGMEELRESGRYVALPHPSGGTVHVLGVYPCSARSVSEVRVLLDAVEPSSVYVDVYPEQLQLMQQEVKQHVQTLMLGDAESGAGAGAAAASAAAPSSRAPGTKRTRGTATHRGPADINDPGSSAATRAVGDASSVLVLSAARRKELETLIGIGDVYTSKLGLAGAAELRMLVADDAFMRLMGIGRDAPYMAAVEWSERRRLDGAEPVPVAPYVFPMEYRDKQAVVRPAGTYVTLIGAPPMYTSIHILMGVNGIPQPDFEMELSIPPEGFCTYERLRSLRRAFIEDVDAAMRDYTFESVDSAKELRASATKDNEVIVAQLVEDAAKQAAATAFSLQALHGPDVVAVMDLGRVAALERAWDRATHPDDLFPEPAWYAPLQIVPYFSLTGITAGMGFATYKLFKRIPKTTVLVGVPMYAAIGSLFYAGVFRPESTQGSAVRASLANPKQPFSTL